MEERLQYILSSVNNWLKYAETKNAALFTANGALIIVILRMLDVVNLPESWMSYYVGFAIFLLVLSAGISLFSFTPQVKLPWLAPQSRPQDIDNLIFFGDISRYEPASYLRTLHAQQGNEVGTVDPLEEDYAEQIIMNSRIALRKFNCFTCALWLTLSALVTPVVTLIVFITVRRTRGTNQ